MLANILSVVSLKYQQTLPIGVERETPVVQSYLSKDLKTNQELGNLVDLLIIRLQHLKTVKAERSVMIFIIESGLY